MMYGMVKSDNLIHLVQDERSKVRRRFVSFNATLDTNGLGQDNASGIRRYLRQHMPNDESRVLKILAESYDGERLEAAMRAIQQNAMMSDIVQRHLKEE